MPKITLSICPHCEKKICDGSYWKIVSVVRKDTKEETVHNIHSSNLVNCSLGYGRRNIQLLQDKSVGAKVVLEFDNWVNPSIVTIEKIED